MKISFTGFLFLLFLGLKLTGYITWAWVWVTAPLWIPLAIAALFFAFMGICLCIAAAKDGNYVKKT